MRNLRAFLWCALVMVACSCRRGEAAGPGSVPMSSDQPLYMPTPGACSLVIISPTCLELKLVTRKEPDPAKLKEWNFTAGTLPSPQDFQVTAGPDKLKVKQVGFKRTVLYAPFRTRDLRVLNSFYLVLDKPVASGAPVEVNSASPDLIGPSRRFTNSCDAVRLSPVLHVNQTGYLAHEAKLAMAGYFLGTLGELPLDFLQTKFDLVERASGKIVFSGQLKQRKDSGYNFPTYEAVVEADFSGFKGEGEYQLAVDGLGRSNPFFIGDGVAGVFARTYALGIYHQRCGTANEMPYTRFVHGACHVKPALVPTMSRDFTSVNESLAKETSNFKDNPRHTAPQLRDVHSSLYPFINKGPLDVSGGHHDAGDYSKYTINSAGFVHHLTFALDNFPGVADLDDLGLPESGDGKSDVAQEIKWEADYLVKMQDGDGGFYFLVYPKDREYEYDVLPDKGDQQVVFPKTTSATAAAVAALAQCAGSATFRKQFPTDAKLYLDRAKAGWKFLERAIAKYGKDGAYQKITHYGDEFMHDDELTWAAVELFAATGEDVYKQKVEEWLKPSDPEMRKWGWWRLYDAYGCAIRSYGFAARSGRLKKEALNPALLSECQNEIAAAGEDQLRRAENCAYGTSFPEETKRTRNAGWYFSGDAAFDMAVAYQLDYPPAADLRPRLLSAILSNLNYEQGCNPVNVTYLTGLGWKRQREIVHQYAQNDRRVLPPTGIPLGNITAGFTYLDTYKQELGEIPVPSLGDEQNPFPFYDRWGDGFNLSQEFVILNQARALGAYAWLMARTSLKTQSWKPKPAAIEAVGVESGRARQGITLAVKLDPTEALHARIVWEVEGEEPQVGEHLNLAAGKSPKWIEAEVQLQDGRRMMAVSEGETLQKILKSH